MHACMSIGAALDKIVMKKFVSMFCSLVLSSGYPHPKLTDTKRESIKNLQVFSFPGEFIF